MKKYIISIATVAMLTLAGACDKFLDELPDSRLDLDTDEKITRFLTSGYSPNLLVLATEMMSDNVDNRGAALSSYAIYQDEYYAWKDAATGSGNESLETAWAGHYKAIATANQALEAIEKLGNPERLNPQRGEALMIRAFHHFWLVNVFGKHYSTATGESDPGVVYMEKPETTVHPYYERASVAEVYRRIERDLEAALLLIDDNIYEAPKYHFNRKAAYAFAARFYLFCRKYDRVLACAHEVLGENPTGMLRDVSGFTRLQANYLIRAEEYVKPEHNANLLLMPIITALPRILGGGYSTGKRYMHDDYLSGTETLQRQGPWGSTTVMYLTMSYTNSGYPYTTVAKLPNLTEVTDPVTGNTIYRTSFTALHADETLLCRAEACILLGQYDRAAADLDLWASRHVSTYTTPLTRERINTFYADMDYYQPNLPTPKKELHPEVPIVSDEQENFLQCLLHIRRIETIFEGLRWFDIKRYGIVIYRRYLDANNEVTVTDELTLDDPRRAVQLPASVISAGLTPNPR
jgi:tetratricopeptide (TPR) repeat protein